MNPDRPTSELAAPADSFLETRKDIELAPESESSQAVVAPDAAEKPAAQSYDFRNPMLLSPSELRKVRLHQEEFCQSAAARLSIHLRSEFSLTLTAIQTLAYPKLAESWSYPTHLTLFKMEPVRGVSVLEITTQLGLCMVDRQMGGPGQAALMDQEISEIEKVLLEQTAQLFLDEWCGAWVAVKELKPVILGYESNGAFIQTITADTMMLVVSMEAGFGECRGKFKIGVPYIAMEPVIQRFCQGSEKTPNPPQPAPPPPPAALKWNACFNDVCVPVTAEWDGLEMTARQILNLKIGDLLPIEPHRLQQINVRIADTLKFQGRPGTLDGQWAVELTQVVKR